MSAPTVVSRMTDAAFQSSAPQAFRRRVLRAWLLAVAALVFAMVVLGGATRVTGSGLSIVEWRPVTGVIPPLSEAAWQAEFDKYRTIPQYRERNRGMSLDAFKTIYWWEWTHRMLGRVIAAAFLLPLLWFLWRGWIEPGLRGQLWAIFGLGAIQGAVGWWMVASGLADRTAVAHERLAFHLTLACVIYAAILWTAQRLLPRDEATASASARVGAVVLLALVLLQIALGALVAGLGGGLIYNTWPLIDGALVPDWARLTFERPLWRNLFDNVLTVQFEHRMVAYAICVVALWHAFAAKRWDAWTLAMVVLIQAALGIATLLYQAPVALALAHQAMAIVLLTVAVVHAERVTPRRVVVAEATGAFIPRETP